MEIHNTDGTNLLLASKEIKFYSTYKEFMDNYPNHLKKWLELQSPYGKEEDFKQEYIQIYEPFFNRTIYGKKFNGFELKIYKNNDYSNVFYDISEYESFLKRETDILRMNDNNPAQVLTSEYQKDRDIEQKIGNYEYIYVSYEVRRVLNNFFDLSIYFLYICILKSARWKNLKVKTY